MLCGVGGLAVYSLDYLLSGSQARLTRPVNLGHDFLRARELLEKNLRDP